MYATCLLPLERGWTPQHSPWLGMYFIVLNWIKKNICIKGYCDEPRDSINIIIYILFYGRYPCTHKRIMALALCRTRHIVWSMKKKHTHTLFMTPTQLERRNWFGVLHAPPLPYERILIFSTGFNPIHTSHTI